MLWIRFVSLKKAGEAWTTSQRASMPLPRQYGSSVRCISATPPPRAVELTVHTLRPPRPLGA
jgi:hypothetical protein